MIETTPNDNYVHIVSYHPPFSAICNVGKAPFHGELEIVYVPDKVLLEFMSFERWLLSDVAPMETTIEELCRCVYEELHTVLSLDIGKDIPLSVTIHAQTTTHAPVSVSIANAEVKEMNL